MPKSKQSHANAVRVAPDARRSLLEATEALLLEQGMLAITTRAICSVARTNVSQIRYYFGNLDGLIDAVLAAELSSVARAYDAADLARHDDLGALVDVLLEAVRAPAAFSEEGSAALVIEDIYRHIAPASQRIVAKRLARAQKPYLDALSALLPELSSDALRYRFSATVALIMAMLPQSAGARLFALQRVRSSFSDSWCEEQLRAICLSILGAPSPAQPSGAGHALSKPAKDQSSRLTTPARRAGFARHK